MHQKSVRARLRGATFLPGLVALTVGLGVLLPTGASAQAAVGTDTLARQTAVLQSASIQDRLSGGETLFVNESLVSGDGSKRFIMQSDGNAVVYTSSNRALFSTGARTPGSRIVMQTDGNLVVYAPSGAASWSSRTAGRPGAVAVMQSDGNLVIYVGTSAIWNSFAAGAPAAPPAAPPAPPAADTLTSGAQLTAGASLNNGGNSAVVQGDGNFVVYSPGRAAWATRTNNGNRLVMQTDGNAVLYTAGGGVAWNSGTVGNGGARMVMQGDGNLVIYSTNGRALWNSFAANRPAPFYANCDAVRAAGAAPLYAGQPGYSRDLDRDGDGVACE